MHLRFVVFDQEFIVCNIALTVRLLIHTSLFDIFKFKHLFIDIILINENKSVLRQLNLTL